MYMCLQLGKREQNHCFLFLCGSLNGKSTGSLRHSDTCFPVGGIIGWLRRCGCVEGSMPLEEVLRV